MSHRTIYNILTIVVTYLLKFIVSYNLDTDSPLIYESLSIDDYFGYSVSLYAGNLDTAWLVYFYFQFSTNDYNKFLITINHL